MGKDRDKKKSPYRKKKGQGYLWLLGCVVVAAAGLWGWSAWASPQRRIPALETFASEGQEHVEQGTAITYRTDPPTSGTHYPSATRPGFYTEAQTAGNLVHSLEHGHIVIYYDPEGTPADVVETLKGYSTRYTGEWDGVVVTPREQEEQVVLTAWRQMLRLPTWNQADTELFMDAFRGRGPENPMR